VSVDGGGGEPLRVALLLPSFWPEVRRGAERMARDLADDLLARGHRPRLVTSHPAPPRRDVEDGLPITRHWRAPEGWLRRRGWLEYMTHVPLEAADLAAGDDDVVQPLYATDAQAAAWHTRRTGTPSVFSYMGIPTREGLVDRRGRLALTLRAVRDCTVTTALSRAAAEHFERWLDVEARVINPGVNLAAFSPGGERHERPTIFCAADMTDPRKRVGLLLEAFREVRRRLPSARLVLSRPPGAAPPGTGDGVEFADVDDRGALADAYRGAWVAALPSVGEAFGLVLLEAMACGTPGVGTDDGGIPEVLDRPEVGRLFRRDDAASLAEALLEALELAGDPATGGACRARAQDFSIERCGQAYEALYRELLAARR
jgi:glycosyltransferase involved in cell wall biosynthesis